MSELEASSTLADMHKAAWEKLQQSLKTKADDTTYNEGEKEAYFENSREKRELLALRNSIARLVSRGHATVGAWC